MDNTLQTVPPIIAVDDSPDDLFFLRRLLGKAGANGPLLTFGYASEAVDYLKEAASAADSRKLPSIVFTDLRMPIMDGLQFLDWIRGERALNRLSVVMLSTSDDPRDIQKSKDLRVDAYYVKFPTKEEVVRLLERTGVLVPRSAPPIPRA